MLINDKGWMHVFFSLTDNELWFLLELIRWYLTDFCTTSSAQHSPLLLLWICWSSAASITALFVRHKAPLWCLNRWHTCQRTFVTCCYMNDTNRVSEDWILIGPTWYILVKTVANINSLGSDYPWFIFFVLQFFLSFYHNKNISNGWSPTTQVRTKSTSSFPSTTLRVTVKDGKYTLRRCCSKHLEGRENVSTAQEQINDKILRQSWTYWPKISKEETMWPRFTHKHFKVNLTEHDSRKK